MANRSGQPTRPRDVNERAKLIVDIASGEVEEQSEGDVVGREGGLKGGKARALKLSPEQRTEIARLAALARWKKSGDS